MAENADQNPNYDAELLEGHMMKDPMIENARFNSGLLMAMARYNDVTAAFCR